MKKIPQLLFVFFFALLTLSGCIGVFDFVCNFAGEQDYHCYQWFAVHEEDPDDCNNIRQAEKFQDAGSNPPKDKCYLMIAERTGDPSGCERIEGGLMSYTVQECIWRAAVTARNPEICHTIEGSYGSMMQTYNTETCLSAIESAGGAIEDEDEKENEDKGECKYDSDCDPVCEGNIMWKMGCNARNNTCEKTFDTDCQSQTETFGELSFGMVCSSGECVRDKSGIDAKKSELKAEKKELSNEVKEINVIRQQLTSAMSDANKQCLSGLADATNTIIIEGATRIASLSSSLSSFAMQGGRQLDVASAMVDYVGDGLNKMYGYLDNPNPPEEKKLTLPEFIEVNCKLYEYFKNELSYYDTELDNTIEKAKEVDTQLDKLP